MDAQEGRVLFRGVICCSGRLYAVQEGYMNVQKGYMLKKIIIFLVATKVIASRPPECRPTGTPTARASKQFKSPHRRKKIFKGGYHIHGGGGLTSQVGGMSSIVLCPHLTLPPTVGQHIELISSRGITP